MGGSGTALTLAAQKGKTRNTFSDIFNGIPLVFPFIHLFVGFESIVRMLIEKSADVNIVDMFGDVPLISAARSGKKYICKLLPDR